MGMMRDFHHLLQFVLLITLVFCLLRVLPGDAIQAQILMGGGTQAAVDEQRAQVGLDRPIWQQYIAYTTRLLTGDLGHSLQDGQAVREKIAAHLPATLALASVAWGVAVVLGGCCGWAMASPHMPIRQTATFIATLSVSLPIHWSGTLLIYAGVIWFSRLPSPDSPFIPGLLLGFHSAGAIAQVFAAHWKQTQALPHVLLAHAKGLPPLCVQGGHILRVMAPALIAVATVQAAFLLGGVVITETLFTRAGLGRLLLDGVLSQDYPLVQGIMVFIALMITILNILADALTYWAEPRLRIQAGS